MSKTTQTIALERNHPPIMQRLSYGRRPTEAHCVEVGASKISEFGCRFFSDAPEIASQSFTTKGPKVICCAFRVANSKQRTTRKQTLQIDISMIEPDLPRRGPAAKILPQRSFAATLSHVMQFRRLADSVCYEYPVVV